LIVFRKESRPEGSAREIGSRPFSTKAGCERMPRAFATGRSLARRSCGRGGGKAPFISRASALPLLLLPLLTILYFSFHPLSSPAMAAGEVAPSFAWPARGEVICPFRPSSGPYGAGGHAGIDISLPRGSDVKASSGGTVSFAGGTPVGLCVSIIHDGGFKTTYVSLGSVAVRRGQKVEAGWKVGVSDGTKDRSSSSPHLHFGMYVSGKAVDPLPFLRGLLLDPAECLFLGPWEDEGAVAAYLDYHDSGGFLDLLGRGFKALGRTVGNACKTVIGTAWRWTCQAARAVGGAFSAFYRSCVQPWFSPLCKGVVEAFRVILSNRIVQAVLAGLAAAAVVCLAVVGIALALSLSLVTTVVAAVVGAVAAIGYSIYYAFAAGENFTFAGCFTGSLTVGIAAAGSCLLLSHLMPLMGVGWSNLGWLGFGKAFLINGAADSLVYITFCLCTGKEVSPMGVLATFLIGGLSGGVGKLVVTGIFSQGMTQALAAGWLSSGGALLSGEGAVSLSAYAWAATMRFANKLAFVALCGCTGFLGDVIVRGVAGGRPSIAESLLSFLGGMLAGGVGLLGGGEGVAAFLSRLSFGRLKISSDFARALMSKSFSKGLKEGASRFLRWLRRGREKTDESIWQLNMRGEM
jgi:hypothetical protein